MSIFDRFVPTPRLVARLVADRRLPGVPASDGPGDLLAPGLRQVAVLAGDTGVSAPVDPAAHGGEERCVRAALDGLRALPRPRHQTLTAGRAEVETFVSEDVFGASRLLMLDELMAETMLVERPSHGMLVIVPNRHMLGVHVLESVLAIPSALRLLGDLALAEHRIAGPLSPWVYFRSPDKRLSLLASPDGQPTLGPDFDAALRDLTSTD
ncbi:MAG: hypothetical protein FWD18_05940 [Micrococcales bacterium]|nr:hypothetical protein [Micrococcales bacterium]